MVEELTFALLAVPRLIQVLRVFGLPRPDAPPPHYPTWPLWFVGAAFVVAFVDWALGSMAALRDDPVIRRRIARIVTEGEHYRVKGAHGGPEPAHDIGIWLGAYGPRMMRVVVR